MRAEYEAELEDVSRVREAMADAVRDAMSQATASLLGMPIVAPAGDHRRRRGGRTSTMYGSRSGRWARCARQAPVASDLRLLFTRPAYRSRTSNAWVTWPSTWRRSVCAAARPRPYRSLRTASVIRDMADVADRIAGKDQFHPGRPGRRRRRHRWTRDDDDGPPQRGPVRGAARRRVARRSRDRRSTEPCSAASTSATPTTRSTPGRRMYFFVTGVAMR